MTKAPSLVVGFHSYKPQYAPDNIDKVLAGYLDFVKTHFTPDPLYALQNRTGYAITTKMGDLFKLKGDADGVDRTLRELERESPDPLAVRYLRAWYAMPNRRLGPEGEPRAANVKAIELLTALATEGQGTYARKALSTLASPAPARRLRRRARGLPPLRGAPSSVRLRLGRGASARRNRHRARRLGLAERRFDEAARTYAANPLARILARALAGNAAEAIGQPLRAVDHYAAALDAWDDDYGLDVSLHTTSPDPKTVAAVVTARESSRPIWTPESPRCAGRCRSPAARCSSAGAGC